MPAIFAIYLKFGLNPEDIKCNVVFFSKLILLSIIEICFLLICCHLCHMISEIGAILHTKSYYLAYSKTRHLKCHTYSCSYSSITTRNYSTSGRSGDQRLSKSKTLASPRSRPYEDLYAGRGRPINEPI